MDEQQFEEFRKACGHRRNVELSWEGHISEDRCVYRRRLSDEIECCSANCPFTNKKP